ncbi:MAG: UPF0149 family protein [Xanthomonadaceae bacterium]|nr:UPF0149 family protein [Xanthomonadaceae bacterium]
MSAIAPLDDDNLERLSELLDARAVPFKGLNLEALDGFLSALAVGPETVPTDEWRPVVWGGKPPRWRDAEEAADVDTLLAGHVRLVEQRVRYDGDDLPDRLAPLIWLPEDPSAHNDDALDVGRDWAEGFLRGVELRETAWSAWLDEHAWIEEILGFLDRLVSGEIIGKTTGETTDETAADAPETLSFDERMGIVIELSGMLADLHHHRIETLTPRTPIRREAVPERNDPCPCGSGKKYKKCHGA